MTAKNKDMRKNVLKVVLTSFFFVLSFVIMAQTNSPAAGDGEKGGTPENPGGTGTALGGGGAPIGTGTFLLIGLAAAYGSKKVYHLYKDNQEELES